MSKKSFFPVLICSVFFAFIYSPSLALQSGGVYVGGLETGSVIGQMFTRLNVHGTFTAKCVDGLKKWQSSISSLDLGSTTTGAPVIFKVRNLLPFAQGLRLSVNSTFAGPFSLLGQLWVNPGQSMFISIPIIGLTTDLTFVTTAKVIRYDSQTDSAMLGGDLLVN